MAMKDLPDGCCRHRKQGTEHDRPSTELDRADRARAAHQQVMCAVAGAQEQAGDPSAQPNPLSEIARPSGRRLLGGHLKLAATFAAKEP